MSRHYQCDYCEADLDDGRLIVKVTDATVEGLSNYGSFERDVCVKCCTDRLGLVPDMKKYES